MSRQHLLLLGFLVCSSVFGWVFAIREKSQANALEHSRQQLGTDLSDARSEIQRLSIQVDALTKAASIPQSQPPVQSPPRPGPLGRRAAGQTVGREKNIDDPRWKHVASQLASHQSQLANQSLRIAQTQEDVRRTGDQLDGRINSTRDELNRSISITHNDVVLLQKRGERSIYEFDLLKSKQFQRVGPLSLSLRKADTKHRSYDISLMVDDKPIEKQHVNLSEPVWISMADVTQPIELVVNQIDKNRVRGYISAPRYKNADLASTPAPESVPAPALKAR